VAVGNGDVVDRDGDAGDGRRAEADRLDPVDDLAGDLTAVPVEDRAYDLADRAPVEHPVHEAQLLGEHGVEQHAADGRVDHAAVVRDLHRGVIGDEPQIKGGLDLGEV